MTSAPAVADPPVADPFVHPALFYRDTTEYLDGVGGFVRTALEAGRPVLVAVPGDRLHMLREGLGALADAVDCRDMTEMGRNPGRILAALQDFADRHPGPVSIVGEPIWAERSTAEVLEATRHEALINAAFTGRPATILCPYDTAGLAEEVVADAYRTHPTLIESGREWSSDRYTDPARVSADCDRPLAPPPPAALAFRFTADELMLVRRHADDWADRTGLDTARRTDFVIAVAEAAGNSVAHGGGSGTLRLWNDAGGWTAEIHDRGRLTELLAGRRRPAPAAANGGRGLWMIHQLCDLVEIRAWSSGLTLRLHMTAPKS
ncbi:anti-sigma factor RsbA family regulatory protein [Streptomyces sp. URMC 123]|uniref:anti-sigma factor RsbA family regulatory protein n=1 Tax=Streptomyces sp. URMC 123 TaxID=3423403 RepID=UPI003F1B7B97